MHSSSSSWKVSFEAEMLWAFPLHELPLQRHGIQNMTYTNSVSGGRSRCPLLVMMPRSACARRDSISWPGAVNSLPVIWCTTKRIGVRESRGPLQMNLIFRLLSQPLSVTAGTLVDSVKLKVALSLTWRGVRDVYQAQNPFQTLYPVAISSWYPLGLRSLQMQKKNKQTNKLRGPWSASELYRLIDRHLSTKFSVNFCG
jgi:hypothetical protein